MALEAGRRLGHYRILGFLGRGGMAEVYPLAKSPEHRYGSADELARLLAGAGSQPARRGGVPLRARTSDAGRSSGRSRPSAGAAPPDWMHPDAADALGYKAWPPATRVIPASRAPGGVLDTVADAQARAAARAESFLAELEVLTPDRRSVLDVAAAWAENFLARFDRTDPPDERRRRLVPPLSSEESTLSPILERRAEAAREDEEARLGWIVIGVAIGGLMFLLWLVANW